MNQATLKEIFDTYRPAMCLYAERLIGNYHTAEDLVSEVFLKFYHAAQKREINDFRAYLYRATANACSSYRKANGFAPVGLPEGMEFIEHRSADFEMMQTERYRLLLEAVKRLPDQCRKVVQMAYLEAKESHEIAAQMNISQSTVLNHKARGIKLLRGLLRSNFNTILTLFRPF